MTTFLTLTVGTAGDVEKHEGFAIGFCVQNSNNTVHTQHDCSLEDAVNNLHVSSSDGMMILKNMRD